MKNVLSLSLLLTLFAHGVYLYFTPKAVELDYIFPEEIKVNKVDIFENITFFMTKAQKKYLKFITPRLKVSNQKKAYMIQPRALIFHEGKDFFLESDEAYLENDENRYFEALGNVHLNSTNFYLSCDKGVYDILKKRFDGSGKVLSRGINTVSGDKITVKSAHVTAYPLLKISKLKNVTSGIIERKRVYEGKVLFRAKHLNLNYNESKIVLDEDVFLKRNNVFSVARKATIFLENFNKRLKYYEMQGGVVITQKIRNSKTGKQTFRKAFGEKLEGSTRERKLTLTGSPRVKTDTDIIRGSKIILRENASILEVLNSTAKINLKDKD